MCLTHVNFLGFLVNKFKLYFRDGYTILETELLTPPIVRISTICFAYSMQVLLPLDDSSSIVGGIEELVSHLLG